VVEKRAMKTKKWSFYDHTEQSLRFSAILFPRWQYLWLFEANSYRLLHMFQVTVSGGYGSVVP
jgi:hypothetical protein